MSNEEENNSDAKGLETDELTKISSQWLASNEAKIDELKELLEKEKQNTNDYIEKWKRALADYENLKKRTDLDIVSKVTTCLL